MILLVIALIILLLLAVALYMQPHTGSDTTSLSVLTP